MTQLTLCEGKAHLLEGMSSCELSMIPPEASGGDSSVGLDKVVSLRGSD